MSGTWILRYTVRASCGGFNVMALLVDVDADGWPVYQILKVTPR